MSCVTCHHVSRVITCPLARLKSNGRPNDQSGARYAELLVSLARTVGSLYPGWRMRIYHNVTSAQPAALASLCSLYCGHQHVDLCDTRRLPRLGDLNTQFPVGRFWRFQALGDPTVRRFLVRDTDAWLLPRERAAVTQWEESG